VKTEHLKHLSPICWMSGHKCRYGVWDISWSILNL